MEASSPLDARIFGHFVRAEVAHASEITGMGLGLYLSREILERHGGRLWFESTEGAGSTFFMTLPFSEKSLFCIGTPPKVTRGERRQGGKYEDRGKPRPYYTSKICQE